MSSSDDSDDNSSMLKEAVDSQFINDSMYNEDKTKDKEKKPQEKLPSLRPNRDENEQFSYVLHVTPEFQKYVAKQLMSILDKQIKYVEPTDIQRKKRKVKPAVKLLKSSESFIDLKVDEPSQVINGQKLKPNFKRRKIESADEESDELKCKLSAVDPQDILDKKEVRHWSNRSKAPVFQYRKTKSGSLEYIEPVFS